MKKLDPDRRDVHVLVCHGRRCTAAGAPRVRGLLARALRGLGVRARLTRVPCQGHCKRGPVVRIDAPRRRLWGEVREADAERLARKLARLLARERSRRADR